MNILLSNYFYGIPPVPEDTESPSWRLYHGFIQNLGSQGKRLRDLSAFDLWRSLNDYRACQYPGMKDGDASYSHHLAWVARNYELSGKLFNDIGAFPPDYDFENQYGTTEKLLPTQ